MPREHLFISSVCVSQTVYNFKHVSPLASCFCWIKGYNTTHRPGIVTVVFFHMDERFSQNNAMFTKIFLETTNVKMNKMFWCVKDLDLHWNVHVVPLRGEAVYCTITTYQNTDENICNFSKDFPKQLLLVRLAHNC